MSADTELIALATLYQDGTSGVRGKIPAALVRVLKAKEGGVLAFERLADGRVCIRKATAAERKGGAPPRGSRR